MILLLTIIVGYIYAAVVYGYQTLILRRRISIEDEKVPFHTVICKIAGAGGIFALLQMLFYPVGGLIADICCGRYRIIISSVFSIWCGLLLYIIIYIIKISIREDETFEIIYDILLCIAALLSMIGFTGFQSNAVQFGLDQLLHASSQELSLFLHWFIWADNFGQLIIHILGVAHFCHQFIQTNSLLSYTTIIFAIIITVVIILSCWKHHWFHSEPHTHNPYGIVYRVLKFAAKHDKPLRRSALTYCDDERPTRIEFAKQKYGGPFTTEMVEDVKTFLRILIMLFVMSPVFTLQVAVAYMFPIYGIHMGNSPIINTTECSAEWLLLQSGNLSYLVTVVFMPLYILFIHPCIPRWMPRILYRLTIGIFLMFLLVAAMFIIQVVANYNAIYKQDRNITCMFLSDIRNENELLNFNIPVLVLPNLLGGIAFPLVYVTILEFISAQSPHSMKGLLLGVFYAFRGFFTLIGCVLIFPFAQEKYWKDTAHVTDCGFYYYLLSTVMGLVGVAAIPAATKWYQYRVREDRPYGPFYVEEYYSRYLRGMNAQAISPVLEGRECNHHHDDRKSTYGTINN